MPLASCRDAVFGGTLRSAGTATDLELTTAWNVNAAYEHFWNPRWRTSLYGGYAEVKYSDTANAILCRRKALAPVLGCCGSGRRRLRQQLEDLVGRLAHPVERHQGLLHGPRRAVLEDQWHERAWPGRYLLAASGQSLRVPTPQRRPIDDQDNWLLRFRVHRDFYP